ncbi:pteridine reductase [Methylomonas sp. MED-D]|uniref:pteridine reductase n=1 Tax=unclassified Methylomonas TaxID=2608980 RepID=UPI0028A34391|nr:pteridine reductase [Methylomonas sp. MV1]MDT4332244.1 pteridine reductase [Methylomonas sp. MV1]
MSKTVLITGAARRIGAACASSLHEAGWNVVLHYYRSEAAALELAGALNDVRPDSAFTVKADLAEADQRGNLIEFVADLGGVDALVNNASAFLPTPFGRVAESDWDDLMAANLKAPYFLCQSLAAGLRRRRGSIVNIADIHAETGLPGYSVYSIAKAGLVAMTRCLAKELAPEVRVNAVAPGAILWPEQTGSEAAQAEILQRVALGRRGDPDDIAGAVRYLLTADYVTGQVLTVDGGRGLNR